MTSVLLLSMGSDTGGVSGAIARAFVDVPDWSVRSLVSMGNYIQYPMDPGMKWDNDTIDRYWRAADAVHLHHSMVAAERLHGGWKGWRLPHRPYTVMYHGTGFREDPAPHLKEMRRYGAVGVCSTLDLWLLAPDELEWLPPPLNVDAMLDLRAKARPDKMAEVERLRKTAPRD